MLYALSFLVMVFSVFTIGEFCLSRLAIILGCVYCNYRGFCGLGGGGGCFYQSTYSTPYTHGEMLGF